MQILFFTEKRRKNGVSISSVSCTSSRDFDAHLRPVTHQASVAKQAMHGLQTITGQPNVSIARRPFFVFWFMSQISRSVRLTPSILWRLTATGVRALTLWTCDHSLIVALEMSKTLLGPIQYLMSLWPCLGELSAGMI